MLESTAQKHAIASPSISSGVEARKPARSRGPVTASAPERAEAASDASSRGPATVATTSAATAAARIDGVSGRPTYSPPATQSAPPIAAALHVAWNEAMMLRPYTCCTATPCMLPAASTMPSAMP
jgi:hypothetical protein